MPTDRHLEVIEISDFAPGLWTAGGTLLMPSQGWQTMENARPEPGGGLRACARPVAWDLTGLSADVLANTLVLGILEIATNERYLWLRYEKSASSTYAVQMYWWNGTTWAQVGANIAYDAADADPQQIMADTFLDTSGTDYVLFQVNHSADNSTTEGLYRAARNQSTTRTRIYSVGPPVCFAVNDDRILVSNGGRTIHFSAAGDSSAISTATGFIVVQGSRFNAAITSITPMAPGDILVGTNGAVWSRIQGDISSEPNVRPMSDAHPCTFSQRLMLSDAGLAFIEENRGVFVTGDGSSFESLSEQIDGNVWPEIAQLRTVGHVVNTNRFFVTPGGYCYDLRTQSWFTIKALTDVASGVLYAHKREGTVIAAVGTVGSWTIQRYDMDESIRQASFTAKTAPIRGADGRRVKVRQVQVAAVGYHTNDTIVVTVNGTAKTYTFTAAGRQVIPFLFHEEGEMLDVTITSRSDDYASTATHEAPTIEAMRIGKGLGHRSV